MRFGSLNMRLAIIFYLVYRFLVKTYKGVFEDVRVRNGNPIGKQIVASVAHVRKEIWFDKR